MSLRDGLTPHPTVVQRYRHLVETGGLSEDPAQLAVAADLDRLIDELSNKRLAAKSSSLGWLFGRRATPHAPLKGIYLYGSVGRGKTMLMDMFFEQVPVRRKRRVHFNAFMADVHDRIGQHRAALKAGKAKGDDPIPPVAAALAAEAWVLCFDEFSVTDIADAMVLSRLFSALFAEGVVLVATSNVAPDDLYRDGLNRGLFLPFIGILKNHAHVMSLDARTDYRLEKLEKLPVYVTPLGPEADRRMDETWHALTGGSAEIATEVEVKGRKVPVPRATGTAARFDFADLCARPLAARDYLAIAERFDTIMVEHIPVMNRATRNEAKRFILLVDTLYDNHMRLIASAETTPEKLYAETTGTEAFEFERTASRLFEMQSESWRAETARRGRQAAE